MGHIVHDRRGDVLRIDKGADLCDRLAVQDHALAEDDELGAILVDELLRALDVDLVDVVAAYREVHDGRALRLRIDGNVVAQRAHGLGRQMAALDDVVVHDIAEALRRVLAVEAVLPVHEGGERGHIAHLAADDARFDLRAAEVQAHLLDEQALDLVDELRALIIEDILIIERQDLLVLGIAAAGVAGAEHLHGVARRILGRNEVDALFLAPQVVLLGLLQQLEGLAGQVLERADGILLLRAIQQRTRERRRADAHVVRGNDGLEPLAADIDLHGVIREDIAVDVAQADGALGRLVGDDGLQALALGDVIRNHRAARHPADLLLTTVDGHTGAHDAAVEQRDGLDAARQHRQIAEVAVHDALEGGKLLLERLAADKVALLGRKADGKLGQRHGEDRHLVSGGIKAHLMAVQRQSSLEAERVARAETSGLCAELHKAVPQPGSVLAAAVDLKAERLARVARLSHADQTALERDGAERVLHRLGELHAAGERHEDVLALRALHGNGRPVLRDLRHGTVIVLHCLAQVRKVLFRVRRIYDKQEPFLFKAVEIGVVDGGAVLGGDDAVLRHVEVQTLDVAAEHMLQKGNAVRALDEHAAHMGDVKEAAGMAGIQVLRHNAAGVLDGHLPSAEIHHRGACRYMDVIELGALEFAHYWVPPL